MDEDRGQATVRGAAGESEERAGAKPAPQQAEAIANQLSSFEVRLRTMIEEQPYTATAIALGLGWLLGRMHRPI
jgi:hypothetical protein